ncbi:MAG: lamin tail domain-containing protein [Rariglobus sp.]
MKRLFLFAAMLASATSVYSQVYITEFMYGGAQRGANKFIELTNFGPASVNISGWSLWIKGFSQGMSLQNFTRPIAPGESVILANEGESLFRGIWTGVGSEVKIEGGPFLTPDNFIRIYNASGVLMDELVFNHAAAPGLPQALGVSAVTTLANVGQKNFAGWFLSTAIDTPGFQNISSTEGDIGNPGYLNFAYTPVPEPASAAALLGLLALGAASLRRRR